MNGSTFKGGHRPFDNVKEFSDISSPIIFPYALFSQGINVYFRQSRILCHLPEQVTGKGNYVLPSFSEGWDLDGNDIEAVEEVFSKSAVRRENLPRKVHCPLITVLLKSILFGE